MDEPKVLILDADKCTGCKLCELVCSAKRHGAYNPAKSLIRVLKNQEMDVNLIALDVRCDFCGRCVEACVPGALEFTGPAEAAILRKNNKIGKFPVPWVPGPKSA